MSGMYMVVSLSTRQASTVVRCKSRNAKEAIETVCDKGRALRRMMQYLPFRGRLPVFLGDDLTDEYGFEAANGQHGWSVLIGEREPSAAVFALPDIRSVHAWLRENAY